MMGREGYGEGKKLLIIQGLSHHLVAVLCHGYGCVANGIGSLVFTDDVTAGRSNKRYFEVFKGIFSVHVQPKATQLIG